MPTELFSSMSEAGVQRELEQWKEQHPEARITAQKTTVAQGLKHSASEGSAFFHIEIEYKVVKK